MIFRVAVFLFGLDGPVPVSASRVLQAMGGWLQGKAKASPPSFCLSSCRLLLWLCWTPDFPQCWRRTDGHTGSLPCAHECPGFPQPLPFLPLDLVSWFSVPECQDRAGWHQGLLGLGMHTNAPSSRQTPCPGRVVGKQEQGCLSHPPAAPQRDPWSLLLAFICQRGLVGVSTKG